MSETCRKPKDQNSEERQGILTSGLRSTDSDKFITLTSIMDVLLIKDESGMERTVELLPGADALARLPSSCEVSLVSERLYERFLCIDHALSRL